MGYKWKFDDVPEKAIRNELNRNELRISSAREEIRRLKSQKAAMLAELDRRNPPQIAATGGG